MPRYDQLGNETENIRYLFNMAEGRFNLFSQILDGKGLVLTPKSALTVLETFQTIENLHGYFTCNGKLLCTEDLNCQDADTELVVRCHVRVLGGKGGFGSMLRALGAQIEKTTNREACRDLSGRRMRDVNNEKAISDWLEKQNAEEEDRARRKKEKLERILNPPRHIVNDSTYVSEIKENAEKVDIALKQGLQKISSSDEKSTVASGTKRHHADDSAQQSKKHKMWLEFDSDESLDEDDDKEKESFGNVASPVDQKEAENECCEITRKECPAILGQEINSNYQIDDTAENGDEGKVPEVQTSLESSQNKQHPASASAQNFDAVENIDLQSVTRAEDLEVHGLERLKSELMKYGLKCGGTLKQRAGRLFLLKDTPVENLDKSLFAKPNKKLKK